MNRRNFIKVTAGAIASLFIKGKSDYYDAESWMGPVHDLTDEQWERVIEVARPWYDPLGDCQPVYAGRRINGQWIEEVNTIGACNSTWQIHSSVIGMSVFPFSLTAEQMRMIIRKMGAL